MTCLSQLCPKLYLCICVFVFVYLHARHPGTLILRPSYQYLFINIAHAMSICNFARSCICVFVYLCICICVFVFMYLRIWHMGVSFLIPLNNPLFKNIPHVGSFWHFVICSTCVFVYLYLCICICVFARHALKNIDFEILAPLHFHNYSTCHVHLHHALKQIQSKEIRNPIAWGGAVALRKLPFDFPGLNSVQICKTKPAVCSNIISEYREPSKTFGRPHTKKNKPAAEISWISIMWGSSFSGLNRHTIHLPQILVATE